MYEIDKIYNVTRSNLQFLDIIPDALYGFKDVVVFIDKSEDGNVS